METFCLFTPKMARTAKKILIGTIIAAGLLTGTLILLL